MLDLGALAAAGRGPRGGQCRNLAGLCGPLRALRPAQSQGPPSRSGQSRWARKGVSLAGPCSLPSPGSAAWRPAASRGRSDQGGEASAPAAAGTRRPQRAASRWRCARPAPTSRTPRGGAAGVAQRLGAASRGHPDLRGTGDAEEVEAAQSPPTPGTLVPCPEAVAAGLTWSKDGGHRVGDQEVVGPCAVTEGVGGRQQGLRPGWAAGAEPGSRPQVGVPRPPAAAPLPPAQPLLASRMLRLRDPGWGDQPGGPLKEDDHKKDQG